MSGVRGRGCPRGPALGQPSGAADHAVVWDSLSGFGLMIGISGACE
jgi:hypothetical protein